MAMATRVPYDHVILEVVAEVCTSRNRPFAFGALEMEESRRFVAVPGARRP